MIALAILTVAVYWFRRGIHRWACRTFHGGAHLVPTVLGRGTKRCRACGATFASQLDALGLEIEPFSEAAHVEILLRLRRTA